MNLTVFIDMFHARLKYVCSLLNLLSLINLAKESSVQLSSFLIAGGNLCL